jgi:hypothetical protein
VNSPSGKDRCVRPAPGTRCGVGAFGTVRVPLEQLPELRQAPGSYGRDTANSVRLADDQTVLGLAAVLRAIQAAGWHERSFADWGVIGAPRYLGRLRAAAILHRFLRQGVRGMSPLVIPHQSLHAVSAGISMGLGSHGPNFGVASGPDNVSEGLLAGLSLLAECSAPGVWVVLTEWETEPRPDTAGQSTIPTHGVAVALGLVRQEEAASALRLQLHPAGLVGPRGSVCVSELAAFLTGPAAAPGGRWSCPVEGAGVLELTASEAGSQVDRQVG